MSLSNIHIWYAIINNTYVLKKFPCSKVWLAERSSILLFVQPLSVVSNRARNPLKHNETQICFYIYAEFPQQAYKQYNSVPAIAPWYGNTRTKKIPRQLLLRLICAAQLLISQSCRRGARDYKRRAECVAVALWSVNIYTLCRVYYMLHVRIVRHEI